MRKHLLLLIVAMFALNMIDYVKAQDDVDADTEDADADSTTDDTTDLIDLDDEEKIDYEAYFDTRTRLFLSQDIFITIETIQGSDELNLDVSMPTDHYVALSFGGTHINSDMWVFVSDSNILNNRVYDMHSTNYGEPKFDDDLVLEGDLEVLEVTTDFPLVNFSVRRFLDTGNNEDNQDYVIELDKVIKVGYAVRNYEVEERSDQGQIVEFGDHERQGYFDMIVHSNETTSYWGMYVETKQEANYGVMCTLSVLFSTIVSACLI